MTYLKRAWNSPTLTTWAYQGVMSLQVLLVAPVILKHFNQVEVAAWYLFTSLNIFGSIVMQRVTLTFSRMIAVATGTRSTSTEVDDILDWPLINRIIPTMAVFQAALVVVNIGVAAILGWYGLVPLLQGYEKASEVLVAFVIHQLGCVGAFYVSRYYAILLGLNAVAVSNRWNVASLVFGLFAIVISVSAGFGIVVAASLSAMISILSGFLARAAISTVSRGRVRDVDSFRFDRDVGKQAVRPIILSLINQMSSMGVVPIAGIFIARQGNVELAASFNFAIRIAAAVEQAGLAPYNSIQPWVSRLMAEKRLKEAHALLKKRGQYSVSLMFLGMIAAGLLIPWALGSLHSSTQALEPWAWTSLCAGMLAARFYSMLLAPMYAINNIVFTGHAVMCAILSLSLMKLGFSYIGVISIGSGILLANVLVYRGGPYREYRRTLALL